MISICNIAGYNKKFVFFVAAALLISLFFISNIPQAKGRDYPAGLGTRSVFIIDLDNDGDNDICVANAYDGTVSVFSNDGEGNFTMVGVYPVGNFPISIYAADMNGDTLPEILVSNYLSATVSILSNGGSMVFSNITNIAVEDGPIDMIAGDIDGDGCIEILTADYGSSNISIISKGIVYNIPVSDVPGAISVADLNHDGKMEIIVAFPSVNIIRFYTFKFENNNFILNEYASIAVSGKPRVVVAEDIDSDNEYEIITAGYSNNMLYIISTVNYAIVKSYTLGGQCPNSLAISDIDGNGLKDIVVALSLSYTVQIFGQDVLGEFTPRTPVPTGNYPLSVGADDLDGSGTEDIVTANFDAASISVLMNGIEFEYVYVPQPLTYIYSVDILDVNAYYDHKIFFNISTADHSTFTVVYENITYTYNGTGYLLLFSSSHAAEGMHVQLVINATSEVIIDPYIYVKNTGITVYSGDIFCQKVIDSVSALYAFEDLKCQDWIDWDYNDAVILITKLN
ncbi:MAG: VCBS repeat-containing protein [Thermoplasmata archaeon]